MVTLACGSIRLDGLHCSQAACLFLVVSAIYSQINGHIKIIAYVDETIYYIQKRHTMYVKTEGSKFALPAGFIPL